MRNKIRILSILLEAVAVFIICNLFGYDQLASIRVYATYLIIQGVFGHYSIKTLLFWDEANLLIKSSVAMFLIFLLIIPPNDFEMIYILHDVVFTAIMYAFALLSQRKLRHWLRESCADRVLIVGEKESIDKVAFICDDNRFALKNVKGFIEINTSRDLDIDEENFKELESIIKEKNINSVIIAAPNCSRTKMKAILKKVKNIEKISYMPLVDGINFDSRVDDFDGNLLITTAKGSTSLIERFIKRTIDICTGLAGCLLLIPLTIYVYITNHKEGDKNPIFFVQDRIGKSGKLFKMYKYRSMVPNAEQVLEELMEKDSGIKKEYLENKKLENDPRITKAGKFLREKSFDEFPQFINLIKGDMSLIGPRPYLPREIPDMGHYYDFIVKSKPGITGMWQTHGRSDTSFEERLILDEYYQRNWSIKLDMTILIKTFKTVLKGKGAK